MKLIDLIPEWILKDGQRVGFTFQSPVNNNWRQSCFVVPGFDMEDQLELIGGENTQLCNSNCAWKIAGGIENASFDTLTVTPSIDGSAGGLWHGFITAGEIK